jgi:PAS domain S-box-containing protein
MVIEQGRELSWFVHEVIRPHNIEAQRIFDAQMRSVWRRTDKLFGYLLLLQWLTSIIVAIYVSPLAWEGRDSYIHPHVLFAFCFGALITLFPLFLIKTQPGAALTRHVIAACQVLFSALFIHLSGGRIETHFHVFGSLAFLSFYRDNSVLVTASGVVLVDHFLRGVYIPQSVFGVSGASPWRAVEHAAWVVFEDFFLWMACLKQISEMMVNANQQYSILEINREIEALVNERTRELKFSENRYQVLCDTLPVGVFQVSGEASVVYLNGRCLEMLGLNSSDEVPARWLESIYEPDRSLVCEHIRKFLLNEVEGELNFRLACPQLRWVRAQVRKIENSPSSSIYIGAVEDINNRVMVEQRIKIQYAVSRVLATSDSFDKAIQNILEIIATEADWQICDFWLVDEDEEVLKLAASYHETADGKFYPFIEKSALTKFKPGIGLPGRVWESQLPAFIVKLCSDGNFPRLPQAQIAGLTSAAGFPVMLHGKVIGVVEFFCCRERIFDSETQSVLAGIGRDIGLFMERLAAEKALRSSENRFANVLGLALDAFILLDKDCRITSWNAQAGRIFGYSEELAVGRIADEILIPEEFKVQYRELWKKFAQGKYINYRQRFEANLLRFHGGEFPAEITLLATNSTGNFEVAAFIRDLSDRREHERVVNLLAAIVSSSTDAIVGKDTRGLITSWNKAAERLFGYTALEVIGRAAVDLLVAPDKRDEVRAFEKAVVKENRTVSDVETTRIAKSGELLDVSVSAFPLKSDSNEIEGMSLIYRDIRERKELEKRMSEFYSIVSHELRTPLTSIRGALGLIVDEIIDIDSPEAREMIGIALNSSERLVRLINDILDLKKIEAGKLELHLEEVDLNELLGKAVAAMDGMARQVSVSLLIDAAVSLSIKVDYDRITQVLTNLISNAIKYSPENACINITAELARKGRVRISVTDEGAGIPEESLGLLFNKFQQIDSSDTRPKEGTGLGLALCKAIVEEHSGEIGVHSSPGSGSTFWFEVPLSESQEIINEYLVNGGGAKQILIVEDDDNLAHMLRLILRRAGFPSNRAGTIKEAFAAIDAGLPKVILLDLNLPDGDGLEILKYLRSKVVDRESVPVIIITGQEVDRANLPSPLIFDCFLKPLDLERLLGSIVKAIDFSAMKTVLLVEDDEDTRRVISAQIRTIGATCAEASNGLQALALTDNIAPDLIILDVGLPKLNGFEVIEVLQKGPYSSVPLLVYSGQEFDENERKKLTLGLTKYLNKGRVSPQQFVQSIKELLTCLDKQEGISSSDDDL